MVKCRGKKKKTLHANACFSFRTPIIVQEGGDSDDSAEQGAEGGTMYAPPPHLSRGDDNENDDDDDDDEKEREDEGEGLRDDEGEGTEDVMSADTASIYDNNNDNHNHEDQANHHTNANANNNGSERVVSTVLPRVYGPLPASVTSRYITTNFRGTDEAALTVPIHFSDNEDSGSECEAYREKAMAGIADAFEELPHQRLRVVHDVVLQQVVEFFVDKHHPDAANTAVRLAGVKFGFPAMKAAIQGAEAVGSGFIYQPPPPLPLPPSPPLPISFGASGSSAGASSSGAGASSSGAGASSNDDGDDNVREIANAILPFISGRKLLEHADDALDVALDAIYLLKRDNDDPTTEPPPRSPFLEELIRALTKVTHLSAEQIRDIYETTVDQRKWRHLPVDDTEVIQAYLFRDSSYFFHHRTISMLILSYIDPLWSPFCSLINI